MRGDCEEKFSFFDPKGMPYLVKPKKSEGEWKNSNTFKECKWNIIGWNPADFFNLMDFFYLRFQASTYIYTPLALKNEALSSNLSIPLSNAEREKTEIEKIIVS